MAVCTPDSVVDNHYSKRPTWLRRRATCEPAWPCSMRGLPCRACCLARGALLPHLFTLTLAGGLFSVALSVRRKKEKTPARPFGRRIALWSPEVPPPAPKLAGSGYLTATYIILNPFETVEPKPVISPERYYIPVTNRGDL